MAAATHVRATPATWCFFSRKNSRFARGGGGGGVRHVAAGGLFSEFGAPAAAAINFRPYQNIRAGVKTFPRARGIGDGEKKNPI